MASQLPLNLPHSASLARDDLIVSASNRLAIEAVDAWPHWRHSVLTIVGPAGSGKTHLVHAFVERSGAVPVGPGDASRLIGTDGFAAVIDDVDRSRLGEEELFGLVNAARLGGGTVLTTSRIPPEEACSLADLRSRLSAATRATISAPDDALLLAVLAKLFADRQLAVAPQHLRYLAERMERSLEAARILVALIDREALATKERIGPRLFKRVLDRREEDVCHQRVAQER